MGSELTSKEGPAEAGVGRSIGLSFNHGDLEHPVFGTASNVRGVIPFQLEQGKYRIPPMLSEGNKLKECIQSLAAEYRELWPNALEPEIESKARDYLLFAIFFNPEDDVDDPKVRAFLSLSFFMFAIDDVLDSLNEEDELNFRYADMRTYIRFMHDLFDGVYKSVDDMLNPMAAIRRTNKFSLKFIQMSAKGIPQWYERNAVVRQDLINSITGWTLLMEAHKLDFSVPCKTYLGAHISGTIPGLEYITLVRGLTIRQEIRDDIVFHKMKEAFGSASHLMNDVLGLKRDLRLNQVRDSSILSKVQADFSLKDSFDYAFNQLCHDLNDVKLAAVKLREAYAGDVDLDEYIACAERALDGQLYFYKFVERYGNLDLHVVPV